MKREILLEWIEEAGKLNPGESIFLHCENRDQSRALVRQIRSELKIIGEIDPIKASTITGLSVIRDQRYWAELRRTHGSPLIGFKKDKEGKTIRVELQYPERKRRLLLMREDGYSLEEAEDIEGELTDEEKELFN